MTVIIGIVAALGTAFFLALVSIHFKRLVGKISSTHINLLRILFAIFFFWIFSLPSLNESELRIAFSVLPGLILAIILGITIGDTLYIKSLKFIEVSRATVISSIYPIFVTLWGYFLGENITFYRLMGTIIMIFAVWLASKSESSGITKGDLSKGVSLAILAAFMWSLGIILVRIFIDNANVFLINALRYPFAVLPLFTYFIIFSKSSFTQIFKVEKRVFVEILITGFYTALANGLLCLSLQLVEASLASPIFSLQPILTSILAVIVLKERLSLSLIISIVLATIGMWILVL